jgi:A/G-specific adenine glycosylase
MLSACVAAESTFMSSRKLQTISDAISDSMKASFRERLLAWYDAHARDLPWRESSDPYPVWLSEIMLQQTRVAAVIAHYHEFLRRFPTVEKLARAREASVLAAWSGLGYYRRARMLHAAAKVVVLERDGEFPTSTGELRELPGVGRYTAAAIASIAFGEPVAVVDGNVERVLQRVAGTRLAGEQFWLAAEEFLDRERPGDFNQAMMELGAVVCTPRAPACLTCPVVELCATQGELAGVAKSARKKKQEIHYALDFRGNDYRRGAVFLVQRPRDARLMAGMWELPEISSGAKFPSNGAGKVAVLKALRHPKATRGDIDEACYTLKHSITVTDYSVRVWRTSAPKSVRGEWVAVERLARVALTGLARKILRKAEIIAGDDRQV